MEPWWPVFKRMREQCLYMQGREARGWPVEGTVGPGWQDLLAARVSEAATSLQSKRATAAAGCRKLVPNGLPPLLHAACSLEVPFPLDQGDTVADDLEFCGRMMVTRNEEATQGCSPCPGGLCQRTGTAYGGHAVLGVAGS